MDHPSLEYYVEIARVLNISKAAENLHISQQSLSAYIQKLEKYYGTPLLVRKPKMKLTEVGERVLLAAEEINRVYEELDQDLAVYRGSSNLQINIGMFIPVVSKAMKRLPVVELSKKYPDVSLAIKTGYNRQLEEMVVNGDLQFAITTGKYLAEGGREPDPSLEIRVLSQDEECVIMTDRVMHLYFADEYEAYLEKFRRGVDLLEIAHIPMIMHPMESGISRMVRQYFMDHRKTFKIFSEVPSQDLVNSMVLENNAFGFCSRNISDDFLAAHRDELHAFPIASPALRREIRLIYRKDRNKLMGKIGELLEKAWGNGRMEGIDFDSV